MSRVRPFLEHEFEAQRGLPETLPTDEKLLWQGSPDWRLLALSAFHWRKIAVYFAFLLGLKVVLALSDGSDITSALLSTGVLLILAAFALALVATLAWLSARTAVYTVTSKRVVMRIGVVLSVTFNLPFSRIESAALKCFANGQGDIPIRLIGTDRIAYLHLWPHVRPWRIAYPEPMLRAIPNAAHVAGLLSRAMVGATGGTLMKADSLDQKPVRPNSASSDPLVIAS
jgi:hypothetical protein